MGATPAGITVGLDGSKVYVANSNSTTLTVIDAVMDTILTTITTGAWPVAFGNFISTHISCTALSPIINVVGNATFCQGGFVSLTSSPASSYTWSNGATSQSILVTTGSNYGVTITDANGCTGTAHQIITVNPTYLIHVADSTCIGTLYHFPDGSAVTAMADTIQTSHLMTLSLCDSMIVTALTVNPTFLQNVVANACQGSTYYFPDGSHVVIQADTTQTSHLVSMHHCDSSIITNLTVLAAYIHNVSAGACQGSNYTFPDGSMIIATADTIQTSHFINTHNCDSSIITTLTVHLSYLDSVHSQACHGSTFTFPDHSTITATVDTIQTSHLTTIFTCDSIVITNLELLPLPIDTIAPGSPVTFCSGDSAQLTASTSSSYLWNTGATTHSIWALTAGNYKVTVTGSNGCTGISPNTNVVVKPVPPIPTITRPNDTVLLSSNSIFKNQWLFNSLPIAFDTLPHSPAHDTGCYSVQAIDTNGCISVSDTTCITSFTTGIAGIISDNAISIYPNPNNGTFNLIMEGLNNSSITINIADVLDQIIIKENYKTSTGTLSKTIDISQYHAGIYFIKIMVGDNIINRKIIVQ